MSKVMPLAVMLGALCGIALFVRWVLGDPERVEHLGHFARELPAGQHVLVVLVLIHRRLELDEPMLVLEGALGTLLSVCLLVQALSSSSAHASAFRGWSWRGRTQGSWRATGRT